MWRQAFFFKPFARNQHRSNRTPDRYRYSLRRRADPWRSGACELETLLLSIKRYPQRDEVVRELGGELDKEMSNSRMPTWYSLIVLGAGRIPGLFVRPRSSPACIRSGWSTGSAEVRAHDRQYADLFRSEPTVESERHPTT